MRIELGVGELDGWKLIEMNNLAVGYFPEGDPQITYPPMSEPSAIGTAPGKDKLTKGKTWFDAEVSA